ncbi:MAG TPA: aldehyde dehydrogenase family protein, partial [Xanthobacteraceae bacterium]
MYENLLADVPTDLWIGGKWRKASDGARFDVIDPATENKITSVASASVEDAKAAVDAASEAFAGWAERKPRERGEILRKAYEVIMAQSERLAKLITLENGKALSDSRGEVAYAAEFFRWYAEEAVRNIGNVSRAPSSGARIFVQHKPAGVAVLVTPWNFPAAMATRKIGPALAAGCPVVLKPASETPLTMLALMPLLEEAGVPAGVVNVIPSRRSGAVVSTMLHDPRVRVVSFTGSTEV